MQKELLTSRELAQVLKIAGETVYRWRKQGMPYEEFGPRTFRYDLDKVKAWRQQQKVK